MPRFSLVELDTEQHLASFAQEVRAGLTARPKRIPCRFFYDETGSRLFEEICELPEYYLTRAEHEILAARAGEIAAAFEGPISLVELGSGNATKTRQLIRALLDRHGALRYVPVDISSSMLEVSARELLREFDALEIRAIAGEYQEGLRQLRADADRPKLVIFLGSTLGNLDRAPARRFVAGVGEGLGPRDRLLLGIDLRKDRVTLERAYDDSRGVTARFNLNLLERMNRELDARFDPKTFRFRAVWNEVRGAVDSFLESRLEQTVWIEALDLVVPFAAGERIHTESSYKYSPAEIEGLARAAGLRVAERWLDAGARFSVNLLRP